MRVLIAVGLMSMAVVPLSGGDEWELVYPKDYRLGQDHVFLSIGAKVYPDRPNEYMIGSQSGWVLAAILGEPEQSTSWSPLKLPFDYDVWAVDVVNDQWIIGLGASGYSAGQVAIHRGPNPDQPELADLTDHWELHELDPNMAVLELACIDNTVLALLVGDGGMNALHRSTDGGLNWEVVPDVTDVGDIEVFQGKFYGTRSSETGVELLVSEDGLYYDSVWTIIDSHGSGFFSAGARLDVVDLATDAVGLPTGDTPILYITGRMDNTNTPGGHYYWFVRSRFYLSSPDGVTWFDHGSTITSGSSPGHSAFDPNPWNPLSVPGVNKIDDWPFLYKFFGILEQSAGNFSIEWESDLWCLTQFDGNASHLVNSLNDGYSNIRKEMISQWGQLAFVFYDDSDQARIVTIEKGGVISMPSLPVLDPKIQYVEQMIGVRGTTYVEVRPQFEYPVLLTTTDYQQWNVQPWPEWIYSMDLKSDGWHLFGVCPQCTDVTSYQLQDDWLPGFDFAAKDEDALAYVENSGFWYWAHRYYDDMRVFQLEETGEWEEFCVMIPEMDWPNSAKMACPDGQRLVVFGRTAEMFIVETDGSWRSAYPWQSIAPDLDSIYSVCYANGWYYILSEVAARTRDFIEFEPVPLPDNEPLIHVTLFDEQLYGFTPNAVFKMPCEKGFLESVEPKPGWHHSDWLGWFQIIDEDLGDIDHLLLGKCWVNPVNELEYWIRTSTLGWIWMYKDWAPWLWRMNDGHWYWLDQDGWPGRAWDYEDQEWEELEP